MDDNNWGNRKVDYNSVNYSPSVSYNYNGSGNTGKKKDPHKKRKEKKDKNTQNEKLILKQNETIIKLLREIRDRLPVPEPTTTVAQKSKTTAPTENSTNKKKVVIPDPTIKKTVKKKVPKKKATETKVDKTVQQDIISDAVEGIK